MKFLNKFREGTLRVIFTFIALYCVAFGSYVSVMTLVFERFTTDDCLWVQEFNGNKVNQGLFIDKIIPGGTADQAGLKNGDLLLAINGIKFKESSEATKILNSFGNELIDYTILRDNQILNFKIEVYKLFNITSYIFLLLGFGFLLNGFLVGYSKPKELTSQLFFFLGCAAVLVFNANGGSINASTQNFFYFFNINLGSILFFPLFIHFFLTYPIKYEFKNRKKLLTFIYLFVIVTNLLFLLTRSYNNFEITSTVKTIIPILYLAAGITLFINSYRKLKETNLRKPLSIILYGFLLGGVGFAYTIFAGIYFGFVFLVNPLVFSPIALVLAIPMSIGYSIFKYRILDTVFIIKKGLVFGIITAFIVGMYLLLVLVLDSILSQIMPQNKQMLTIALIIIVTFSFDFVNKKAKEFVDKQFYRERYNYRKSLLLFSEELPYLDNMRKVIEKIGTSVKETMGIDNLNVWFKDIEYYKILQGEYEKNTGNEKIIHKSDGYNDAFSALFKNNKEPKLLNDIYLQELDLTQDQKDIIRNETFVLSIPIYIKDNLIGAMNFGEKPSGKAYSDEDIDLLKTLASQAVISFENSRLQKEKISKQKIEEELQIARKIQMGLLPQFINTIKGMEISGFYNPAKVIGGDFYDCIKLSETKMLVIVADVSGKGIPAAIYMSKVQAMIQFAASIFQTPKEILIEVNKQIHQKIDRRSFITTIVALFDMEKMTVKICRAGHNPVIYSVNGKLNLLKNKGMGLGLESEKFFDDNLEETEISIAEDNMFVFYSDGLTEAMNKNRDEFGTDKIIDIIYDNRQYACSLIQKEIISSVNNFRGSAEQNDDITLVVTKIKAKS
ncbi:MAG: SpoIIE family protein phosphatase [Ignavibacteria bacterium]